MIWAGRLNAILLLTGTVGAGAVGAAVLWYKELPLLTDILLFLGLALVGLSVLAKIAFTFADLISRAFRGEPLIYDKKIDFERGAGGRISE